ncbi:MAG: hypothetical protein AAF401_15470 [Pseudomonadota bacterium]
MDETAARDLVAQWAASKLGAPSDFKDAVSGGRLAGIYVPFWTFDSVESVEYLTTIEYDDANAEKNGTYSGDMDTYVDDLLFPASSLISPVIRDSIARGFSASLLRPFLPHYLAGFAAEQHHQTVEDGLRAAEEDKRALIRTRAERDIQEKTKEGRISSISTLLFKTSSSGVRYRRILLPVWLLHFEYRGEAQRIVIGGIDGGVHGEAPISNFKLAIALSAIALGGTAIYLLASVLYG